ncbi:MAG TPA: fibronectin type III domain-containing protein [Parapedobacter sp.]|uniref:fibronectin type III domain-containing protein n=1 Tax=Parapedobacter sp. TaxID=1958893 RepID=UPI002B9F03C3|nr:fibronectin type III domain-containing protein [Parapedobacter sp.]HWK58464.1 fibronectin type III domain-containing protein [Parapedobacter sp.]
MKKRTARSGFKHMKDQELLTFGYTVHAAMDGNAYFATPEPDLATLLISVDDFRTKMEMANRKGSPLDFSLKNDSREVLIELLKQLAFYVNKTARGDLSIILSSGFRPVALPTKSVPPQTPLWVTLSDYRQKGQARLDFEPVDNVRLYEYQYTDEVDASGQVVWPVDVLDTPRSSINVLAPLQKGVEYYVRVRAKNGVGASDWTDPVSILAR